MEVGIRNKIVGVIITLISIFWIWRWATVLMTQYELSSKPYAGLICFMYPEWVHYVNIVVGLLGMIIGIKIYRIHNIGMLKWYVVLLVLIASYVSFSL